METGNIIEKITQEFETLKSITSGPMTIDVEPGETIIKEGETGNFLYVVKEGIVEIKYGDVILERISEGQIFGEMALIDDAERSASVVAHTAGVILAISRSMFRKLVRKDPGFALLVMNTMNRRIRQMNVRLKISTDSSK